MNVHLGILALQVQTLLMLIDVVEATILMSLNQLLVRHVQLDTTVMNTIFIQLFVHKDSIALLKLIIPYHVQKVLSVHN